VWLRLLQAGWWRAAKQVLLVEMPLARVAPNAHCCAAAISSCGNAGELRQALELLEWMRHASRAEAAAAPPGVDGDAAHGEGGGGGGGSGLADAAGVAANAPAAAHVPRNRKLGSRARKAAPPAEAATAAATAAPAAAAATAAPSSLRPPPPNAWCYGAAVAACDRATGGADGNAAVALLDQMASDGLTPNVVSAAPLSPSRAV